MSDRFIWTQWPGHLDLIEQGRLFDRLYVSIFFNHEKKGYFYRWAKRGHGDRSGGSFVQCKSHLRAELAVEVARRYGVTSLVWWAAHSQDFLYELGRTTSINSWLQSWDLTISASVQYQAWARREFAVADLPARCRAYVPESVIARANEWIWETEAQLPESPIWTTAKMAVEPIVGRSLGPASILALLAFFVPCPTFEMSEFRKMPPLWYQPEMMKHLFVWFCHCCRQARTFSDIVYAYDSFYRYPLWTRMTGSSSEWIFSGLINLYGNLQIPPIKIKTAGKRQRWNL